MEAAVLICDDVIRTLLDSCLYSSSVNVKTLALQYLSILTKDKTNMLLITDYKQQSSYSWIHLADICLKCRP